MQFTLIAPPPVQAQLMCNAIERRREEVERLELRAAAQTTCEQIDKILARNGSACGYCHGPITSTTVWCPHCHMDYGQTPFSDVWTDPDGSPTGNGRQSDGTPRRPGCICTDQPHPCYHCQLKASKQEANR